MSFVYDTQMAVWINHIRRHIEDDNLALLFELLMADMHDANHKVPSANGTFRGDGINHDTRVCAAARKLDEYIKEKYPDD